MKGGWWNCRILFQKLERLSINYRRCHRDERMTFRTNVNWRNSWIVLGDSLSRRRWGGIGDIILTSCKRIHDRVNLLWSDDVESFLDGTSSFQVFEFSHPFYKFHCKNMNSWNYKLRIHNRIFCRREEFTSKSYVCPVFTNRFGVHILFRRVEEFSVYA